MNKQELSEAMAASTGMTKKSCLAALEAMMAAVTKAVAAGDHVTLMGFGTFEAKDRAPRIARNPRTGESIALPSTRAAVFRPGDALRKAAETGEADA